MLDYLHISNWYTVRVSCPILNKFKQEIWKLFNPPPPQNIPFQWIGAVKYRNYISVLQIYTMEFLQIKLVLYVKS